MCSTLFCRCLALSTLCLLKHLKSIGERLLYPQQLIIHDKIAFTQYRSMKNQIDHLQGICDIQMYSRCPACPKVFEAGNLPFRINCSFFYIQGKGSTLTIAIDANFGLCRKRSSGRSAYDPKAENMMFMNQKGVDNYIKDYSPKNKLADVSTELLLALLKLNNITFIVRPVTTSQLVTC